MRRGRRAAGRDAARRRAGASRAGATAAATPRPRAEGRRRQGAGAAGPPPSARRRTQAARRPASGRRGAGREPPDSRAPRAAPARLPGRRQLPLERRPAAHARPSRRPPARGCCARTSTGGRSAPTRPADARDPFDPRLPLRRPRRAAPERAAARASACCSRSGARPPGRTATRGHNHAPTQASDLGDFAHAVADALLGHARRLPVRAVLLGLERAEPRAVPRAAVRRARPAGRAGDLRAAVPRRVRRDQGRAPQPRSRSARRRRAGATTSSRASRRRESPGRFAQLLSRQRPRLRFDAWAHHPYPTAPSLPADPGRPLAERDAVAAAAVRGRAAHVVRAQQRADLDHRVRVPDEPAGHARRLATRSRPRTCSAR